MSDPNAAIPFADVLESAPDACVLLDRDLRVTFANRQAREYANGEPLVGRDFHEAWPDAVPGVEARIRRVIDERVSDRFEFFYPRHDAWFDVSITPTAEGASLFCRDVSAAKRTEIALSISEGRYREMMQQSPLSVQILMPNGHTRWVNDSFTRIWGGTLADLEGFNLLADPQLEALGLREPIMRAFAGEVVVLPRRRFDASKSVTGLERRDVRAMAYPVRDAQGQVVEVVLMHEDVTEVAVTEERMAYQEQQLRTALEGIGAGQWELSLASGELRWSPEMYQLLNLPPTEVASLDRFVGMMNPADRDGAQRHLQRAIANLGTMHTEFRVDIPGKGTRWLASVARVLPGPDGQPERAVGINFDVTDRVETQATLERTERSLALAMKGGRMGYWTREMATDEIRREDRVEWSPELEEVFGLAPGTFEGTEGGFFAFVHKDDLPSVIHTVETAVREGVDYTIQFRYRHASGEWRWMEGRGRATYDDQGRPLRMDGIGIDITLQKQSEEARRLVEDRFRRLANSLPAIVWSANAEGRVEFLNDQWVDYTGIDLEAYHAAGGNTVIHPEDTPQVRDLWNRARVQGSEFRTEARYRRHDGVYRWFIASAVPTRDAEGEIIGWFGTATDIHDQKQTEATLRLLVHLAEETRTEDDPREIVGKTERLLRAHLGANRCAYAEMEEDNDHFTVELDDCVGCPSIVGRYPLSAFGPRALRELRAGLPYVVNDIDREAEPGQDLAAYRITQIQAVVCISMVKDGRMIALMAVHQTEAREWTAEEIALIQMIGDRCWSDIARARANRRLATSESQYRQIAEALPQLVWSTRPDGHHDYFNTRWYEYTGVPMGSTDGEGWGEIVHPGDRLRTSEVWEASLATGGLYQIEYRLRRYDGAYRWFLGRALPIRDVEGRIVRWFGTCTDIHEQKEAEAELEARVLERTAELEAANRELEGFTYTVSHDLRAPLRAIMATSMILLEETEEKLAREERELLARQAHNARRLGVLIDDLLQMSRIGRQALRRESVDLVELAREVVQELRDDGRANAIEWEFPDALMAKGDAALLRFVVLNLLENAAKFSPPDSRVTLGRTADGAFFVRDHGIGFEPRYANKLFLPFERLVNDSEYPGTGIGLANVKRIIDRHGGRVWAEAEPGEGATFFFTLPE
ncbi:MAG: PAS domain-containing protein [Fimbriimonas sp.]